jgi:hypothetical protein
MIIGQNVLREQDAGPFTGRVERWSAVLKVSPRGTST